LQEKKQAKQNSAPATDTNTITEVTAAFSSINIAALGNDNTVESLELIQPLQEVVQNDDSEVIPFVGYLDDIQAREKAYDRERCKKKRGNQQQIGASPVTRAQVKDRATSRARVRAILIQYFFQYIQMTTPPIFDFNGHSTKEWPTLKFMLVVLDGFKPNCADGGKQKEGSERRDKSMIALISASENVCREVLHAISEGIVSKNCNYEQCFAYNLEDALNPSADIMDESSEVDENEKPRSTMDEPKINWGSEKSLLHHFPLRKNRGCHPIPFGYLSQYSSDKSRKKVTYDAWRGYDKKLKKSSKNDFR
jgi:hypothetical protein